MNIKDCLADGSLAEIEIDNELVNKELKEAGYDFSKAKIALAENDFKWCIVKSYYAIFHAAKAVLFKLSLREKRHFAVGIVLDDLSKKGKLESKYVDDFWAAMEAREGADYSYSYSKENAQYMLGVAEEFISRMKKLLNEV